MKVTLGGDRLGSGNKLQQYLHNYYRSTHNLSQKWASSMASGVLYPFLCLPVMRGDKFEIDLEAACRTIPTKGPLFGSYKMQLDVFQVPVRLYQALLHNNPASIGLKMNQVKLPILQIQSKHYANENALNAGKINNSALVKYMGLSGLGHSLTQNYDTVINRRINAVPFLGYYEIFKTYYANKQEENAYVIGIEKSEASYIIKQNTQVYYDLVLDSSVRLVYEPKNTSDQNTILFVDVPKGVNFEEFKSGLSIEFLDGDDDQVVEYTLEYFLEHYKTAFMGAKIFSVNYDTYTVGISINWSIVLQLWENDPSIEKIALFKELDAESNNSLAIKSFKLQNIDDMRMKLLSFHQFGTPFTLWYDGDASDNSEWGLQDGTDGTGLPYSTLFDIDTKGRTQNQYPLNGLMLKTYQSDIYNNWIRTEWIDGENGIAAMTAVSVTNGSFKIDALNMAEKLYDLYNRIAVSGNTYEDWQDAVWTEMPKMHIETPIYLGGMSSEVVFEEIVQTAPAATEEQTNAGKGLGTLGGRGTLIKRKGGNVQCKIAEPSFIIGIVSLTPRVFYTQGNEFYLTDLFSVDDFHKPALDGIGFQNLLGERLAWWDTKVSPTGVVTNRSIIGKLPAWIDYMTAVDKAYGDFADDERGEDGANFMILSRRYEHDEETNTIKDASTYIDPEKYNYAFAYTKLDAQNFWVEIYSKITARRYMSAKQIPNI